MRGCQYVLEPVGARRQVGPRFLGKVRGVVVQDQPNRALRRIVGIQILEQGDEFHTPVALLDTCGDVPVVQVQTRQNRPGAIADVLMIAGHGRIFAGHRRPVRSGVANGLHAGFFIHRDRDHDGLRNSFLGGLVLQRDLLIYQQHLLHFRQEAGIPALQVVRYLVRMQGLCIEDALHRGFSRPRQGRIAG
jgi:hypothetical protein